MSFLLLNKCFEHSWISFRQTQTQLDFALPGGQWQRETEGFYLFIYLYNLIFNVLGLLCWKWEVAQHDRRHMCETRFFSADNKSHTAFATWCLICCTRVAFAFQRLGLLGTYWYESPCINNIFFLFLLVRYKE